MKRWVAILLALVMLTSCQASEEPQNAVTVYFPGGVENSGDAMDEVMVEASVNADRTRIVMETLLSGADGHPSPYAQGVELVGIEYQGGGLTITLSHEYYAMSETARAVADASAVLSLCKLDDVTAVRVGEGEWLFADDIITGSLAPESLERELVLHFTDGGRSYVVSEVRTVLLRDGEAIERYVMEELLKGPGVAGLVSALPDGTVLEGIARDDGVCYVNLSTEFLQFRNGALDLEIRGLYAIANSLGDITGVDKVVVMADGTRLYEGAAMRPVTRAVGEISRGVDEFTVYLPSQRADALLEPVGVRIEAEGGYDLARLLAEFLVGGVDGGGFMSPFPSGTRVNSVSIDFDRCVIDFSKELLQNGESTDFDPSIAQMLALTMGANIRGISAVVVTVDGEVVGDAVPDYAYVHPELR